jgi:hypothetical protein
MKKSIDTMKEMSKQIKLLTPSSFSGRHSGNIFKIFLKFAYDKKINFYCLMSAIVTIVIYITGQNNALEQSYLYN